MRSIKPVSGLLSIFLVFFIATAVSTGCASDESNAGPEDVLSLNQPDSLHGSTEAGEIPDTGAVSDNDASSGEAVGSSLWITHAWVMGLGTFMLILSIVTAMIRKKLDNWLQVHLWLGYIGVALILAGAGYAFYMVGYMGYSHLSSLHSWMGLIEVIFVLDSIVFGLKAAKKGSTEKIKLIHRITGRITILVLTINIISGLIYAGII